ncbi:MAG: HEAT repeat domain-containing protein [Phycisphaerae bacterium]|nr:HEAT repeat domain-containing protein [Phycisphaerae bacterium]
MHRCIGLTGAFRLFDAMIGIMKFFGRHSMGLVLVTSLLMLGALGGTVIFYPMWVDSRLIEKLGSDDSFVRGQAIADAGRRAQIREAMKLSMVAALDTESDTQFFSIITALTTSGMFKDSVKNPLHIDRAAAIEFATAPDPYTQVWLLSKIINQRHDNRYVRQALKSAASSKHGAVRADAAILAAVLKDDAVLGKLLDDEDPAVRASAALDAGLAGRKDLAQALVKKLGDGDASVAGNAAAGLAYMNRSAHSTVLCQLLGQTQDEKLRQRLCHVMTILNNDEARKAVGDLLASGRGKSAPSAMAILSAGKLKVDLAAADIRQVLDAAVKDRKTNRNLVHAAIESAGALKLPVREQLHKICLQYWNPDWRAEMMFASTVRLLGSQSVEAPNRKECEQLLIGATYYAHRKPTTAPAGSLRTTPIASGAAATAFWLLNPSSDPTLRLEQVKSESGTMEFTGRRVNGAKLVMDASRASILAGDYMAWFVGRSGRPEAFRLGLQMLPAINAPPGRHVYNENTRGAGAMMLAMSARSDEQKKIAIQRITERLEPGQTHNGEDDPVLAGRYRCALLILGDKKRLQIVRDQRNNGGHAVPAAFTALLLAGDDETLDYLLHNTHIPAQDVAAYMIYDGLDRVLATCLADLPTVDSAPSGAIQLWQANIVRDYYVIRRGELRLGSK